MVEIDRIITKDNFDTELISRISKMEIKYAEPEELKTDGDNPNQMTETQLTALETSIKRFGSLIPIVVDQNMMMVDGEQRLNVYKRIGLVKIPYVQITIDDSERRILRQTLNKLKGTHDYEKDLAEFQRIIDAGKQIDLKELMGWNDKDISRILDELNFPVDEDEMPEIPKTSNIKTGDIFLLGNHRLMCGDATNGVNYGYLMGLRKADMVFTDPPYGVDYTGKTEDALKIKNDGNSDAFSNAIELMPTKEGATFYCCCPSGNNFKNFLDAFEKRCYQSSTLIWVKNNMVLGHGDYHYQHEPILYGWDKNGTHNFYGDRTQTTIWNIDRPTASREHPTMKPIELVTKAIKNSSLNNELILDPFGGSGSTLIAAEMNNRVCFMMEIDPIYCAVILDRWQKITGKDALREADGVAWNVIKNGNQN